MTLAERFAKIKADEIDFITTYIKKFGDNLAGTLGKRANIIQLLQLDDGDTIYYKDYFCGCVSDFEQDRDIHIRIHEIATIFAENDIEKRWVK